MRSTKARGLALALGLSSAPALLASGCATTGATRGPVNRAAADFDLPALGEDGQVAGRVSLSSVRGQVTLLDFWASWCGPCREELPALEELRKRYAGKPVAFLTVNLDSDAASAAAMVKQLKVGLPVGLDAEKKVASAYDLPTMPSSYVIDRDGVVRYLHEGFYGAKDVEKFQQEIDALLK